jgi:hypothetical protein
MTLKFDKIIEGLNTVIMIIVFSGIGFVMVLVGETILEPKKEEPVNRIASTRLIEYTLNNDSIKNKYMGKTLTQYIKIGEVDYTFNGDIAESITLELRNTKERKVLMVVNENRIENIIRK